MASDTAMRRQSTPASNLYDAACELLYAAHQVRAAASERDATPGFAATIGCLDASLDALAEAVSAMGRSAAAVGTVEREFAALAEVLRVARVACDQTRERTAPVLAGRLLA